jgi:mannose-6-phosphate isomerase-like protein (cupin superfamily)
VALYIDTDTCEEVHLDDAQGTVKEIMNASLCGASSGTATLRRLSPGEEVTIAGLPQSVQLLYVIEGNALLTLKGRPYPVTPGAGVYLDRNESIHVAQEGTEEAHILHLIVPPQ